MIDESGRMIRRASTDQIGRRAACNQLVAAQRYIDHIRVGHRPGADAEVEPFLQGIDRALHQDDFHVHERMAFHERAENRAQEQGSDRGWSLDAQHAFDPPLPWRPLR